MVHTGHSDILCVVIRDERQWEFTEETLEMLDETVKTFKLMLVNTIDEHCSSSLYTLKSHLLFYIAADLRKFLTLSVLGNSLYESFNVQIKHLHRKNSQNRQTRMTETVNDLKRG